MKIKWTIIIPLIIVIIVAFGSNIYIPMKAVEMITNYEPYSFEKVFEDPEMRADYGINECKSPECYGFSSEELDYHSLDSTALNGWYIKSKKSSDKCIIFIHGRTSNRLKTMKYLALADSFDLDTAYNIFIPDLRNSGKSAPSKTYMGYKFGEDVTATLLMLNQNLGQDTVILYGFSMGAMAISNALGRPELSSMLKDNSIIIEKTILDSPLANVKETIRDGSAAIPLFSYYFEMIFEQYSEGINGFGEHMRLSKLLPKDIPILILQSKDDHLTLKKNLDLELNEMADYPNLRVAYFEGPDHVRLFQDDRTRVSYLKTVEDFLFKK